MLERKAICRNCGSTFAPAEPVTCCPECGGTLSLQYDLGWADREIDREDLLKRKRNLSRYKELLPVEGKLDGFGAGFTPVVKSRKLFGGSRLELFFKLDFMNPTGSFKDRGTAVVVSRAIELGFSSVADDSSGNAGASLAAYSARSGLNCKIYAPEKASGDKLKQIMNYGAELVAVPGPRENAAKKITEELDNEEVYYAAHNLSPYFVGGMKTLGYEIAEGFDWNPPARIVVPVGGGGLLLGIYRGLQDLLELGWINELPKLYAVQSRACAPVATAFRKGLEAPEPVEPCSTVAEGVHINNPPRGGEILDAVRDTEGEALAVAEARIEKFYAQLPEKEGVFVEPTSAVPLAGIEKMIETGEFDKPERVLVPLTGSGLKSA